ncbi:MAG: cation transporter [Muribaculaceae bacterium]|nr:cation transporter [Muribaculaceae bacterium]
MIALLISLGLGWATARDTKVEDVKTTVFVTDIHCESCSTKIMNNVPALGKGIKDVVVSVADKTVAVTYYTSKNSDEKIVKGLRSLHVEATPVAQCKPCCIVPPVTPEQAQKMNAGPQTDCCKDN